MGATVRWDYADDIKNHRFEKLAALLRKGEVAALDQNTLNLLADYLENPKRPRGAPRKDNYELAEYLYDEFCSLRRYGKTNRELNNHLQQHATQDNFKHVLESLEKDGMLRKDAIMEIKKLISSDRPIEYKRIESLIDAFRNITENLK